MSCMIPKKLTPQHPEPTKVVSLKRGSLLIQSNLDKGMPDWDEPSSNQTSFFQGGKETTDTWGLYQVKMGTSVSQETQEYREGLKMVLCQSPCQHLGFDLWPLLWQNLLLLF